MSVSAVVDVTNKTCSTPGIGVVTLVPIHTVKVSKPVSHMLDFHNVQGLASCDSRMSCP